MTRGTTDERREREAYDKDSAVMERGRELVDVCAGWWQIGASVEWVCRDCESTSTKAVSVEAAVDPGGTALGAVGSGPGATWTRPGAPLDRPWGHLDPTCSHLAPTWRQLYPTCSNLDPTWGHLYPTWRYFDPSWRLLYQTLGHLASTRRYL